MRKAAPWIGLATLIAVMAALMWLNAGDGSAARDRQLDASLIGTDGLQLWLQDQGVGVVHSNPRLAQRAADFSLGILPLYDIDLSAAFKPPTTPDEEMLQASQRDMDYWTLHDKLRVLPTLVVLPKWRTGFYKSAVAHESTLIPLTGLTTLIRDLDLTSGLLIRLGPQMMLTSGTLKGQAKRPLALFWPQLFQRNRIPSHCQEKLGLPEGALVLACYATETIPAAFFLSDPDLLNNHGLGLAQNATLAADLVAGLRRDVSKPVYLDTSTEQRLVTIETPDERQDYSRGWDEFARFFDYPLSVLWAVAAAVLALAAWRGLLRFGPARALPDDTLERSKTVGIEAKARLLRLSGNDGRMVAEFVRARLDALSETWFGAGGGGDERLFKLLGRRDPAMASHFQTLCTDLMARGQTMPQHQLYQSLATFRDLLERLTHGPDQISKPD